MVSTLLKDKIKFEKLEKKTFFNFVSCKLDLLVTKYNFYYSGVLVKVANKDVVSLVLNRHSKNKHKCILYYDVERNTCYFIQYSKEFVKIFYTNVCESTAYKYNKKLKDLYKYFKNINLGK